MSDKLLIPDEEDAQKEPEAQADEPAAVAEAAEGQPAVAAEPEQKEPAAEQEESTAAAEAAEGQPTLAAEPEQQEPAAEQEESTAAAEAAEGQPVAAADPEQQEPAAEQEGSDASPRPVAEQRRPRSGPRPRAEPREGGRSRFGRRRVCSFCVDKVSSIDYKDAGKLRRYLSDRARIDPRRKTGTCQKHQRWLSTALKRARQLALLPYSPGHIRMSGTFTSRR